MGVRISVTAGNAVGRVFELTGPKTMTLGRGVEVDVTLDDTALSRKHASLTFDGTRLVVRDLGSKHGTYVNGERASEAELRSGDRFQVGSHVMEVQFAMPQSIDLAQTAVGATLPSAAGQAGATRCRRCGGVVSAIGSTSLDVIVVCEACRSSLIDQPQLPPSFELVRVLGRGAMGCVYSARNSTTGELVAIKQILPKVAMSARMRQMFIREASVQQKLVHPNIVRVHQLLESEHGTFSLVMELVGGESADSLITEGRTVEPALAIAIGVQALAGLAHAHAQNIVHRDIKEGNLMLVRTAGGPPLVKVADFGLAKNFHDAGASGMTNDGAIGGTIPYMAREQLLDFKYVKPPADVFALGATLYRLLTGCYPRDFVDGKNWIVVALDQPIVPIRERLSGRSVPQALAQVVERALAERVEDRYASANEMREALLRVH